jgi:hypothetical protein
MVSGRETLLFVCYVGCALLLGVLINVGGSARRRLSERTQDQAALAPSERDAPVASGSYQG